MSKARYFADRLISGQKLEGYKEGGNSMIPLIKSNQPIDLDPIENETELKEGDIVFCKVHGSYYTHLILKIKGSGDSKRYQIGNNKGSINGWIPRSKIFGIVVKIHS